MIQVNLVPDVKLELIKAQRHRSFVISAAIIATIAAIGVVVALSMYVFGYQLWRTTSLNNEIKQKDQQFHAITDVANVVTVQKQLASIQEKNNAKSMTSRVIGLLSVLSAKETDNSTSISAFDIDTATKTMTITAQTDKKGFDAAEVFRKNLEGTKMLYTEVSDTEDQPPAVDTAKCEKEQKCSSKIIASDVTLSEVSYGQDEQSATKKVNFKITFTYDQDFMSPRINVLTIKGLNDQNVTDSYRRIPQSLFTTNDAVERNGSR